MPPAICDSEDEDGDLVAAARSSQRSIGSWAARQVNAVAATLQVIDNLDGADERTTGSTAQLRDDLRTAGLDLFPASNPSQNPWSSLNSVQSVQKSQADAGSRHQIIGLGDYDYPERSLKRQKTTETSTTSQHDGPVIYQNQGTQETRALASFANDCAIRSEPQQSAPVQASTGLPDSTLFQQFIDHEPLVMFQDTGDTLVDNASLQERMIADAIAANAQLQSEALELPSDLDPLRSPSFPYSSSNRTTQKTAIDSQDAEGSVLDNVILIPRVSKDASKITSTGKSETSARRPSVSKNESPDTLYCLCQKASYGDMVGCDNNDCKSQWFHYECVGLKEEPVGDWLCPVCRDSSQTGSAKLSKSQARDAIGGVEIKNAPKLKKPKGQKKTADSEIADLGSQYFDFGDDLPQEQYQPRPSRRRTIRLDESASKSPSKPTRSSKARPKFTEDVASDASSSGKLPRSAKPKRKVSERLDVAADEEHTEVQLQSKDAPVAMVTHDQADDEPPPSVVKEIEETQAETKIEAPEHAESFQTTASSSKKNSKRSQTNVSADHMEDVDSIDSPKLHEQQAQHKSALQDVPNKRAVTNQRKRRIVQDDDDDDDDIDELAMKSPDKENMAKKRGRGRPPKAKSKQVTQSAGAAVDDSEKDDIDLIVHDEKPVDTKNDEIMAELDGNTLEKNAEEITHDAVLTKKKGRGRPPKVKSGKGAALVEKPCDSGPEVEDVTISKETDAPIQNGKAAETSTSAVARKASQTLTPPPEKAADTGVAKSVKVSKPEQLSHAPTNPASTTKVAKYRVGLSKRQRIQPLHSSIRRK